MRKDSQYRFAFVTALAITAATIAAWNAHSQDGRYAVSYVAGSYDTGAHFMGGTEMRVLAAHAGRLYAGNGYWEDRPGPEGSQGAAILVLDRPATQWRVERLFDERLPGGRPRDLAVSALNSIRFGTDGTGARLSVPVTMLLASTWDLTGATRVFARADANGTWTTTTLSQDPPARNFLPQIRSFVLHRDRQTGVDHVFAGNSPRGIFSGVYDARGSIRWDAAPEAGIGSDTTTGLSGSSGRVRVTSLAECDGSLYAPVGQQIYQRVDGATPSWRLVYTNPRPGHSESGLRGLTAISKPEGSGDVLLAAVEGDTPRILRFDPTTGKETQEVDLREMLTAAWGTQVGYVIAAYNDMAKFRGPDGDVLLIGLEAFIRPDKSFAVDHLLVDVGYGRLEGGGWYLVRHHDGRYDLLQIAVPDRRALVAVRSIAPSPFTADGQAIYFAGYDANKSPAHNTAWIIRADGSVLARAR
jgi:hypothetical protein